MLIALISGSAGDTRCGVGDYTYELAQHLALDAEVHLFHDHHHGPLQAPLEKLTTFHLHEVKGFSVFSLNQLAHQLRNAGYDIIHLQYPSKGYGTSVGPGFLPQKLSGMQSRSRVVLTLHEWTTSHPLRKMVMDQMLPSIDALIVTSMTEMKVLTSKMGKRPVIALPVGNVLRSRAELEDVWLQAEGKPTSKLCEPQGPEKRIPMSLFHYGLPARGKGLKRLLNALALVRSAGIPVQLRLGGDYVPGDKSTEALLGQITELDLAGAVVRIGHIPHGRIEEEATKCCLGVFPFDEGFSSKRSSVAAISHLDLPIAVGADSKEQHPYYAPEENTPASLSVLLVDLFKGRLAQEWTAQVKRQREYGKRFSFTRLALQHLDLYQQLRRSES